MAHPLEELAKSIERRTANRRTLRGLESVLADKHLAADIGLPHRPRNLSSNSLKLRW